MQHGERSQGHAQQIPVKRVIFMLSGEKYNQLSLERCHKIQALLAAGHNQSEITPTIGVQRWAISRELDRDILGGKAYRAKTAQRFTDQRHAEKTPRRRFSEQLKAQARQWLTEEKLSLELISGRWQVLGISGVSHEVDLGGQIHR